MSTTVRSPRGSQGPCGAQPRPVPTQDTLIQPAAPRLPRPTSLCLSAAARVQVWLRRTPSAPTVTRKHWSDGRSWEKTPVELFPWKCPSLLLSWLLRPAPHAAPAERPGRWGRAGTAAPPSGPGSEGPHSDTFVQRSPNCSLLNPEGPTETGPVARGMLTICQVVCQHLHVTSSLG